MTTLDVAVPYRPSDPYRKAAWLKVQEHLDRIVPWSNIYVMDSGHTPFNRAASRNAAVAESDADVILLMDADTILYVEGLYDIAVQAKKDGRVHLPYTLFTQFGEDGSVEHRHGDAVGGAVMISREAYNSVNGQDERFQGWGFEDTAFSFATTTLLGPHIRHEGHIECLWHPILWRPEDENYKRNKSLCDAYDRARGKSHEMRKIVWHTQQSKMLNPA